MKEDTGWNKSTVFMMLKRMLEKKIIRMEEGARCKQYYPVLRQEEASNRETENFLSKVDRGSVGMMISSLAGQQKFSQKEIVELKCFGFRNADTGTGFREKGFILVLQITIMAREWQN